MTQDIHKNEDGKLYDGILATSQKALENGYCETAYHALVAAMHLAYAIGDEDRLQKLLEIAKAQLDWIDLHIPENRMSSQSAVQRQGINLYNSLIQQTHADLLIVKQQHRRERNAHLPWFGDTTDNKFSGQLAEPQ